MELFAAIHDYIRISKGPCEVYPAPFAVKLFHDNKTIVEPDISVICDPNKLTARGCTDAPDWIIEIISPSNPSHDFILKLHLYADAGVREYWIIDPRQERILIYNLELDNFSYEMYTFQDRIKANIYDDLWINFKKLNI